MRARLISSGWWVVPAALIATAAMGAVFLARTLHRPPQDASSRPRFDLTRTVVPRSQILATSMPPGGLKALVDPVALTPAEVDHTNAEERGKLLVPSDRVIGVVIGGAARAYPLRLLAWHEAVNDTLGGRPLLVTYSGLADAAVVLDRRLGAEPATLAVAGLVYQSAGLLYDRRPGSPPSLWCPLDARAVAGPEAGVALEVLPSALTTWSDWRARHPEGDVLAPDPETAAARLYRRDPYNAYFGSELLRFPVDPMPPADGPAAKDRVLVVEASGTRAVLLQSRLVSALGGRDGSWTGDIAGVPVVVHVGVDPPTAWAETASGELLPQRSAFWFAWHALHPEDVPEPPTR